MTARAEPTRRALLAARRDVHFGAAVYGSFLVASLVGVAFEAGQDARAMTTLAFTSALVFGLAHWWSEVIGEQISAGEEFRRRDVLVVASSRVSHREQREERQQESEEHSHEQGELKAPRDLRKAGGRVAR